MSTGTGGKGAPNYVGLAEQMGQQSQDLNNQQTWANRPNMTTPWGSYTWTPPPGSTAPDYTSGGSAPGSVDRTGAPPNPARPGMDGFNSELAGLVDTSAFQVPPDSDPTAAASQATSGAPSVPGAGQWSLDVSLNPAEQAALDQSRALRSGANQAALDRLGAGISGQGVEDALYGRLTSRLDPQWQQREDQMRTRLYNQGLREGDTAFTDAMATFGRDRNDAYQGANYQAILGGDQSAAQQVALINALRSGNGVSMPGQPGFSQAGQAQGTDYLGAANASAAYAAQNNPMNLIGQLAPYAFMLSDARLKTNIHYLDAEALPGVRWATWDWKAGGKGHGVIAQDVEKVRPELVRRREDGYLEVDYSRIGA